MEDTREDKIARFKLMLSFGNFIIKGVDMGIVDIGIGKADGLYAKSCDYLSSFNRLTAEEEKQLPKEQVLDYKMGYTWFIVCNHVKTAGDAVLRTRKVGKYYV